MISTQTSVGDLFALDPNAGTAGAKQITRVNDELFTTLKLSEPEEIWWTSFDGKKIEGWLMKPPDFDTRRRSTRSSSRFTAGRTPPTATSSRTSSRCWPPRATSCCFPNPRGSSNYGQDFGNIIQFHYPGDDYKDLMAGVDEVVKRGYIDSNEARRDRRQRRRTAHELDGDADDALCRGRVAADIADWYGFWFTADFTQFTPSWFRKAPWEDPQDFAARSPITHVER